MNVMMAKLGDFSFGLDTATFQEMSRSTEYRWPGQERIGAADALQFTGRGPDTITLPGVIYPHYRGGLGQIDGLRKLAGSGKPLLLVDGRGAVHGEWVIERIEETQSAFLPGAVPRKISFSISLRRYGDG